MARLSRPGVVGVYQAGTVADQVYVAMEHVDAQTLHPWLRSSARTVAETVGILSAAVQGLAAAHRQGLVHRDSNPGNVLVAPGDRPKVTDFGPVGLCADTSADSRQDRSNAESALSTELAQAGEAMGTPAYMAPDLERLGPKQRGAARRSFRGRDEFETPS